MMPLPSPNDGESRSDWMNRCMANPTMNSEYPDSSQRYAVCSNIWDRKEPEMSELKFLEREAWHEKAQEDKVEAQVSPLRKGFASEVKSVDKEDRSFSIVISDESEDRDRDTIKLKGWSLKEYRKNPVVQWAHNHGIPALARSTKTVIEGDTLVGNPKFPEEGVHPFADMIFNLFAAKILKASSVGFVPKEYEWNEERRGYDFLKQTLLEFSLVNVPANANALVLSQEAGIDVTPMVEWAESVLDVFKTPEEIITATGTSAEDINTARNIAGGNKLFLPVDGLAPLDDGDILIYTMDDDGNPVLEKSDVLHRKGKKVDKEEDTEEEETDDDDKFIADAVSVTVENCARCGEEHKQLIFQKLTEPVGKHTHWALCPKISEPIMMYMETVIDFTNEEEKETEADEPNPTGLDLLMAASSKSDEPKEEKLFDADEKVGLRESVQSSLVAVTGRLD